jgi:hypothetical protein
MRKRVKFTIGFFRRVLKGSAEPAIEVRHSRAGGNPAASESSLDSRLRGNDRGGYLSPLGKFSKGNFLVAQSANSTWTGSRMMFRS